MKITTKPVCFQEGKVTSDAIRALRALESGEANAYQQRLALQTIITGLCGTYQTTFIPGNPDQTTFMQGRTFPGERILHYLRLDPGKLRELEEEEKRNG